MLVSKPIDVVSVLHLYSSALYTPAYCVLLNKAVVRDFSGDIFTLVQACYVLHILKK